MRLGLHVVLQLQKHSVAANPKALSQRNPNKDISAKKSRITKKRVLKLNPKLKLKLKLKLEQKLKPKLKLELSLS